MADANIRAVITAEDRASATLKGVGNSVNKFGAVAATAAKAAAVAIAAAASAMVVFGVKTAASLESSRQGFVTLLGSAEKADKTMARIKKEAARTPFEIAGLTQATQLLSSVTKNGDRALDFILDIGEGLAAMGRGQAELDRISVNLQQIAATGRAFAIDIRQFAFAGIPIYEMLTEQIGLSGEALQQFIEEGGVTFELLEKMFADATAAGGRWAGAYKNQAGTFNQLTANMKDAFAILAADIITKSGAFNFLKGVIQTLTEVVNGNNAAFNRVRQSIVNVFNTFRPYFAAIILTIQKELIPAIQRFVKAMSPDLIIVLKAVGAVAAVAFKVLLTQLVLVIKATARLLELFSAIIEKVKGVRESVNDFIGDAVAKIPGIEKIGVRAAGGPVASGSPYIVGERGPELFVPKQSGDIVPNHALGGGSINLSVNVGVYAGTELEKRKLAETLLQSMKDIASSKNQSLNQMMSM